MCVCCVCSREGVVTSGNTRNYLKLIQTPINKKVYVMKPWRCNTMSQGYTLTVEFLLTRKHMQTLHMSMLLTLKMPRFSCIHCKKPPLLPPTLHSERPQCFSFLFILFSFLFSCVIQSSRQCPKSSLIWAELNEEKKRKKHLLSCSFYNLGVFTPLKATLSTWNSQELVINMQVFCLCMWAVLGWIIIWPTYISFQHYSSVFL